MATDEDLIIAPCVNAPVIINGVPAAGYRISASETIYGNKEISNVLPSTIALNNLGLPERPIFIEIGLSYIFELLPPSGSTPIYIWTDVFIDIASQDTNVDQWNEKVYPVIFVDASTVRVNGDVRSIFQVGRRAQLHHTGSEPIRVGTIDGSTYDGTRTTLHFLMDIFGIAATVTGVRHAMMSPVLSSMPYRGISGINSFFRDPFFIEFSPRKQLNTIPIGTVTHVGLLGPSFPGSGWMICNGALLSRTTEARLFSAIGTTYGAGNGTTTFAIPDSISGVHAIFAGA